MSAMAGRGAVITGVGAVSSYGRSMAALHRGLASQVRNLRSFPLSDGREQLVGIVEGDFSADLSRSTQLALWAAEEALADFSATERAQTAIILGGTTGGMRGTEAHFLDAPLGGLDAFTRQTVAQHPVYEATNTLAEKLGLGGPRSTLISACSSGLNTTILAQRWLASGMAKRVLAVGTDAVCRLTLTGFASLGAVDPQGARPFQRERKGISIGEGAAAFVIERDGARPARARLLGNAIIAEAFHATQPDPSGNGAERAMRQAMHEANVAAGDIDAVSAHGTGTPHNDAMECAAIARVFNDGTARPLVSSQKSQLGHTLGAAGSLELAACVAMIENDVVYATFGLSEENLDPACANVAHVLAAPQPRRLRALIKNSFAFGGQNACVVLGAP